MTEIVKWTEEYSVGVEEVDEQHQKLFAILGNLVEATSTDTQEEKIGPLLDEMAEYAEYHFTTEQTFLTKHPDFSSHLEKHLEFVQKTVKLKNSLLEEEGNSALTCHNALVYLFTWLQKHILEQDVKIFSSLPAAL